MIETLFIIFPIALTIFIISICFGVLIYREYQHREHKKEKDKIKPFSADSFRQSRNRSGYYDNKPNWQK